MCSYFDIVFPTTFWNDSTTYDGSIRRQEEGRKKKVMVIRPNTLDVCSGGCRRKRKKNNNRVESVNLLIAAGGRTHIFGHCQYQDRHKMDGGYSTRFSLTHLFNYWFFYFIWLTVYKILTFTDGPKEMGVSVEYLRGLPQLTVPLPSRKELW